jgi:hypothetical protein
MDYSLCKAYIYVQNENLMRMRMVVHVSHRASSKNVFVHFGKCFIVRRTLSLEWTSLLEYRAIGNSVGFLVKRTLAILSCVKNFSKCIYLESRTILVNVVRNVVVFMLIRASVLEFRAFVHRVSVASVRTSLITISTICFTSSNHLYDIFRVWSVLYSSKIRKIKEKCVTILLLKQCQ